MPRILGTAKLAEFEMRITPSDGLPIRIDELKKDLEIADVLIVSQEGGTDTDKKLHYHAYVKGNYSKNYIQSICRKHGKTVKGDNGNATFAVMTPHDNTIGYIVKEGNVVLHNQEQHVIDEYFRKSEDYVKDKEKTRKQIQRKENATLSFFLADCTVKHDTCFNDIVKQLLGKYAEAKKKFPPRSAVETAVLAKMFEYHPDAVVAYYCKNINYDCPIYK